MNLINITNFTPTDIRQIWALAGQPAQALAGTFACSFEGNGIRTRTTFIQALLELGLSYIELPNLLKSAERACDLAGYLDPFYTLYVVRESNHARLQEFANASSRPVINAMSRDGHPCEVLADAYFIESELGPIERTKIGLWGPTTNVFKSWHQLARVLGFDIYHFCAPAYHTTDQHVLVRDTPDVALDVLITDAWPSDFQDPAWSLTREHLARLGNPKLLPTPPFSIGKELSFDPAEYFGFVGYAQKRHLLPVHRAIITHTAG